MDLIREDAHAIAPDTRKCDSGGMIIHPANASPIAHPLRNAGLGFNGELLEPASGHYLLGAGYRAYNPVIMRFNAPDNLSPFGDGGLNAYAYCLGEPVNQIDPSGHEPFLALKSYVSQVTGFKMKALKETLTGIMTPRYPYPDLPSVSGSKISLLSDDGVPLTEESKHTYATLWGEQSNPATPAVLAKKAPDPQQSSIGSVAELPDVPPDSTVKVSTVVGAPQTVELKRPGKMARLRKALTKNANRALRAGFAHASPIIPPRF